MWQLQLQLADSVQDLKGEKNIIPEEFNYSRVQFHYLTYYNYNFADPIQDFKD